MRRREAVSIFREICECVPDAFVSKISLNQKKSAREGFELRINVFLGGDSFGSVQSIVNKRGLTLKEDQGSLLIYRSQASKIEIGNIA